MKKNILILLLAVLLLTSCNTYTGAGAATGGYFGSMVGSMIGGISDGRRGSNLGGLVGLAGGAVLGAVVGNAADREIARSREEDYQRAREERYARRHANARGNYDGYEPATADNGYFDPTNSGDDRITFDNTPSTPATPATTPSTTTTPPATAVQPAVKKGLIIRNAQFDDANHDGVLVAGEECRVSFEIMNYTDRPVYDIQPLVYDLTGNKHIHISQNLHVESIMPNRGIRYTATIKGDSRLKNGEARIRLGVAQGNRELDDQSKEFVVTTRKR